MNVHCDSLTAVCIHANGTSKTVHQISYHTEEIVRSVRYIEWV